MSRVLLWGTALCVGLAIFGVAGPKLLKVRGVVDYFHLGAETGSKPMYPFQELLKLMVAAVLGLAVTSVHKHFHDDRPMGRSLEQAQILLCLSGAMMMIIIGDSLARAFGIAGAASIIRFRTPVEDPKDTIILFLMLGLGMACGLGAIGLAVLASAFLCVVLMVLDRMGEQKPRTMMLEVIAAGSEFPVGHVQQVLQSTAVSFEAREVSQGPEAAVKYYVSLSAKTSLEELSSRLLNDGSMGIKSVAWGAPKREKK